MSFISKWGGELLLPIAGILLTAAFAPFNYAYLAVVSLAFVFLSWLDCSAARACLRGFLYGLGLFGSGVFWVYISIHDYGGAPVFSAVLLTLFFVSFFALFPALTGYLAVKITGQNNKKLLLVIPLLWILIEYFRGHWLLNGFPWLQIGYTQIDTPLKGFVPITGSYGTGLFLALTASSLVAGYKKVIKLKSSLIIVVLLWVVGAYLQTVRWTKPLTNEAIKVALVQGNISQEKKWLPQNRITTLLAYRQMTYQNWTADVIVWPETAIPAYLSQVKSDYLTPLSILAKANQTDIVIGLPTRGTNNEYYNSVITIGVHQGQYNKGHLLPFGEYLPLQPFSGYILDILNIPLGNFTPGGIDQKLLVAGGYPFATSICYEDAFGNETINTLPEASYLINVTNDAWFGDSIQPHQHMQIAQMRALETGRYMLRSTNTGVTAIVSPKGRIINKAPMFKQTVLKGKIIPMKGMTPYARTGDKIILLAVSLWLFIIIIKPIHYAFLPRQTNNRAK